MMKTSLKAAVAGLSLILAGTAGAADLPSSKYLPAAPALPSLYSWTGFYVGAQVGYTFGEDTMKELLTAGRTPLGVQFVYHPDSVIGGAQAGFNYQIGALVLGVEGDIEATRARDGFSDPSRVRSPNDPGGVVRVQQDWQGSVRGRLGYAFDRFMIYGAGGVSFTEFHHDYFNPLAGFGESGKISRTGWNVGGGINVALTNNLIFGLDYRYTDFGSFDYIAKSAFRGLTAEHNPQSHAVRGSIAYKF